MPEVADAANIVFTKLEVANNKDGRMEVFGLDKSGEMFHTWQNKPNGNWQGWERFPDANAFKAKIRDFRVGKNEDGRLEVFAVDEQGISWHVWQLETKPSGWGNWTKLGVAPDRSPVL